MRVSRREKYFMNLLSEIYERKFNMHKKLTDLIGVVR